MVRNAIGDWWCNLNFACGWDFRNTEMGNAYRDEDRHAWPMHRFGRIIRPPTRVAPHEDVCDTMSLLLDTFFFEKECFTGLGRPGDSNIG